MLQNQTSPKSGNLAGRYSISSKQQWICCLSNEFCIALQPPNIDVCLRIIIHLVWNPGFHLKRSNVTSLDTPPKTGMLTSSKKEKQSRVRNTILSNSTVPSSRATTLNSVKYPSRPVFEQVWNITDGVAVGKEVPSSSAITIIVKP
jgi:hypothetical protein